MIRGLFGVAAICFGIAAVVIGCALFGVIRAFNDIAAKGSASSAVVAVGFGQTLVIFVIGAVFLAIAIVVAIAGAISSRRNVRSKT